MNIPPSTTENKAGNLQPDANPQPEFHMQSKHPEAFPKQIDEIWSNTEETPFITDIDVGGDDSQQVEGGLHTTVGGFYRRVIGIEPFVWVRNCSNEEIVAVVSDYRPRHIFTGVVLNASPISAGIGINFGTYTTQSMSKRIPPKGNSPNGPTRSFSVPWKQSYAFVSVFLGEKKEFVMIENDRVPLGGLAVFDGSQLEFFDHEGNAWK
ncbi:hypothetical protein DL98DRAFT_520407 [Cadophora sp. DSE1049]|nr:hypothetical protein DL98DRAFT_520407 [Cadophora sp. DSE1049]